MEALTADDVAILDIESSTIAGHTCKLVVLERGTDGAPSIDDVRAHVGARLRRVPRCCQCLAVDPIPAWTAPADVDIAEHVRLAPAGEDLTATVARAMAGRLDRSRPLWDIEVLPEAGDGRWALVWRVHHAMADGMTMMHWASDLLWDEPPVAARTTATPEPPTPAALPSVLLAAARTALSLGRELRPAGRPGPFGGRVGPRRQAAFAQCTLDDLRAIERRAGHGVTVNDVVLCAVAGSLRRWCRDQGAELDGVRVKVPVSMHVAGPDVHDLGNRDSFMFVDLPLGEADPMARLRAVNRETRERKTHHDAEAVYDVIEVLERVSPPLAGVADRLLNNPREFTLNVSNVPGPRSEISVLGRQVRNLYSFAEVGQRHPVRIAAVSLCEEMQFGVLTDPELVPRTDALAAGIEDAVGELLSA